jgi:hypothetical protein
MSNITENLSSWNVSENNVERLTDNIPFTSAHPDDTLVLVGPPRYKNVTDASTLHAVGMLQALSYSQNRALQPMQAIGSGRAFFISGKSTVQFQIQRLFVKGKNLMRALYENAKSQGALPVTDHEAWGEASVASGTPNFVINLDSPLFLVPFGLMIVYRDRSNSPLGGVYLENCMIGSYQSAIQAGQTTIMESVNGISDRLFPVAVGAKGLKEGWPVGSAQHASAVGVPDKIETYMFGDAQKIGNNDTQG